MRRLIAQSVLALLASPILALDPAAARAEYERMTKLRFAAPVPLTAPVVFTRDTATWTLSSGTVRLMEPLADGTVTGLVFEGQGTFHLEIPDRFEVAQLRRFSRRPDIDAFEQAVSQLVIRTSDGALAARFPTPPGAVSEDALASKRHQAWLVETFEDVDARVLTALLNPGAEQFIADMRTPDFDWIRYDYDSGRVEEMLILRSDLRGAEAWVSLDRAADRGSDGRPSDSSFPIALRHIDVKADLTNLSREVGRSRQPRLEGKYIVEETLEGLADVTHALTLGLIPTAKEVKAFAEDGTELFVMRIPIGKRSMQIDNRLQDDDVYAVLAHPLRRGEKQRVRFEYELETANYAPGRSWYPTVAEGYDQKHTARLEITVRKKNEVRSMGRMERLTEENGNETSVWIVDRPAKMITFSTATSFEEVKVAPAATIPPVVAFGPAVHFYNTAKLRNVAADVANSMQYFQTLFASNVDTGQVYVTSIVARHGQAFDGFLHMAEATFASEQAGASELFRSHEVAHTWWGHKVGWKTYRDQWMSEAFSEYCAMMFVRDSMKNGDRFFDEILRSYEGIVKGNLAGGFSRFNRPWLVERSVVERQRVGPIGHGWRASTFEIPTGYLIQTYFKGPLVLHMLRTQMAMRYGSDERFVNTMRDFLREYDGKSASTDDFRRVLERNTGTDFSWFFDAWIYRAEIPSYTWKSSVKPEGSEYGLTVEIERRDVGDDFVTVIPIRVEMEGGKTATLFIRNEETRQTVSFTVPARPTDVTFAPDSSLLAYVKRR